MRNAHFVFLAATLLFAGCGSNKIQTPAQRGLTAKDTPQKGEVPCPAPLNDMHMITMTLKAPLPARLALKLDGDSEMRVSECSTLKQTGVIASLARIAIPANTVTILVDHNHFFTKDGYTALPKVQGFELFEVKCDGSALPVSIYKTVDPKPLDWRYKYPAGPTCAFQNIGTYIGTQTDVGDIAASISDAEFD